MNKRELNSAYGPRSLFSAEHAAIWLVAVIGLSLSWAALWIIEGQLEVHTRQDFEWVSHNRVRALKHGIEKGLEAVSTVRDLYRGSQEVTAEEFQVFASSLLGRYRGIQALMWVPRVPRTLRSEFERARGMAILPLGADGPEGAEVASHFPVTYLAAREDCAFRPGLDLGSEPTYADFLSRAERSGEITASGRIVVASGADGPDFGFMAAVPVFSGPSDTGFSDLEPREVEGFVIGLFRLRDLTDAAIALLEPRGVEVLIRDESAPAGQRYLHFYESRLAPRRISEVGDGEAWSSEGQSRYAERIRVADRDWSVICGRTQQFRSAEAFREGPWVVLFAGLVFTLLLSFYLARIKENARERLAMEQRLIESEELFRQMTETVDEVFWATSAGGDRLLYLSPAYDRVFGLQAKRQGQRNALLSQMIPEEDRTRLRRAFEQIRRDGVSAEVVHRVNRPDGAIRWVRTHGFPVADEAGEVYRMVGFMEDITERKLADEALRDSEAKLRDMFQQSPDIIMTVDPKGKIVLMNRSVPALPAERAVGRNSLALVPAGFRKWYRKALKKVFRKGKTERFQYSTKDSQYWEGRIVPIRGHGPITAAMVVATDVTEKRNLQQQALRNARLASVGVLAAGVAHEVNNPNNSIAFNASLVSRAWQDVTPILREYYEEHGDFSLGGLSFSEAGDTLPELLAEITRNSQRIKRIVGNLKHMARQDTGQLTERVDIQQVLEATVMVLHNQVQKHTDVCSLEVPDDLPPVRGNSQQLEQVFINVLLNALQSLPDRRHGVFVRAALDEARENLVITFRDEGRGIPERDLGRVTEPFFTTRSDAGGTGLGLSITRSIIEKHGGSMKFESELGKGTTVTVKVPVIPST